MARSLREAGAAALSHLEALYGLLKLELGRSVQTGLGQKMALLLLAAFMAFFGYLFVWCLLTMIMAYYWNIIAGLAVTAGFHILVAAIALAMFSRIRVTPIAPATAEET